VHPFRLVGVIDDLRLTRDDDVRDAKRHAGILPEIPVPFGLAAPSRLHVNGTIVVHEPDRHRPGLPALSTDRRQLDRRFVGDGAELVVRHSGRRPVEDEGEHDEYPRDRERAHRAHLLETKIVSTGDEMRRAAVIYRSSDAAARAMSI